VKKIAKVFATYFKNWGIRLPAKALERRRPGQIQSRGWTIQYRFGKGARGVFLDCYATHRMTNDRHFRIYESGETKDLPAAVEMYVYPIDVTKAQEKKMTAEYEKHNAGVAGLLKRKGFQ
jgi:hypothetical protein